ncbi:amidase [Lysinibacter sp. HNR]|uniref:amidase n=1 Tax=Lysinibacter sp. HNR TaxID=3031408 RepID=UPI0024347FF7|nr:amidase [Lysinibacter sp. HNR]WGD36900.1 amidase [Lysinibacter sp. HNR]
MTKIHELGAVELRDRLARGELSPVTVTEHFLDRIAQHNRTIEAFVTVTADRALARAAQLESARSHTSESRSARLPLLWGMPLADKDLSDREGVPTGLGSRIGGSIPASSDYLTRSIDTAGAVSLGKTATPEFGLYGYTETEDGAAARHPQAPELGAGGSSGGAAAAVAAGLLPFAPGSDGGGSIRIPAATTGLVGIKPSRGLVPADAASPHTLTGVVSGPIAHTVADATLLLDGMLHPTRARFLPLLPRAPHTLTIGTTLASPWDNHFPVQVEPGAQAAFHRALTVLAGLGHRVLPDSARYPDFDYSSMFTIAWQRAAASIPVSDTQEDLLGPVTRELIHRGRALSDEQSQLNDHNLGYYGAELRRLFAEFDVVITPALAQGPRPVGSYSRDTDTNFSQQVCYSPHTSAINVAGLPAVVVPVGRFSVPHSELPLPVGVQLIGRFGDEALLLRLASQLESALGE